MLIFKKQPFFKLKPYQLYLDKPNDNFEFTLGKNPIATE
jgi:hypothetical protein